MRAVYPIRAPNRLTTAKSCGKTRIILDVPPDPSAMVMPMTAATAVTAVAAVAAEARGVAVGSAIVAIGRVIRTVVVAIVIVVAVAVGGSQTRDDAKHAGHPAERRRIATRMPVFADAAESGRVRGRLGRSQSNRAQCQRARECGGDRTAHSDTHDESPFWGTYAH